MHSYPCQVRKALKGPNALFIILLGTILVSCEPAWNKRFMAGEITTDAILQVLPIGSSYRQLTDYIRANGIPKYDGKTLIGYSGKQYSRDDLHNFGIELEDLEYFVTIDGHEEPTAFPSFSIAELCFCFDKEDRLIYLGRWQYP